MDKSHDYNWICGPEPECRFCGCSGPVDVEAKESCPGGHYETAVILSDIKKVLREVDMFFEQMDITSGALRSYMEKYKRIKPK